MPLTAKTWREIFLFCLGIFIASAFCMKWLETGFETKGSVFTIIGLEISYSQGKVEAILSSLSEPVWSMLRFQLIFDFIFMAGVYPGIASLCMLGTAKAGRSWKRLLTILALLQLVAWACDIYENICLLNWMKDPFSISDFQTYHAIVIVKWLLALLAVLVAIPFAVKKNKRPSQL